MEGVIAGKTPKVVDPISPLEDEVSASGEIGHPRETRSTDSRQFDFGDNSDESNTHLTSTRSTPLTSAHTFGAQYAWFRPRWKGNSRDTICLMPDGSLAKRKVRRTAQRSRRRGRRHHVQFIQVCFEISLTPYKPPDQTWYCSYVLRLHGLSHAGEGDDEIRPVSATIDDSDGRDPASSAVVDASLRSIPSSTRLGQGLEDK